MKNSAKNSANDLTSLKKETGVVTVKTTGAGREKEKHTRLKKIASTEKEVITSVKEFKKKRTKKGVVTESALKTKKKNTSKVNEENPVWAYFLRNNKRNELIRLAKKIVKDEDIAYDTVARVCEKASQKYPQGLKEINEYNTSAIAQNEANKDVAGYEPIKLKQVANVGTYLHTAVRNLAIDEYKDANKKRVKVAIGEDADTDDFINSIPDLSLMIESGFNRLQREEMAVYNKEIELALTPKELHIVKLVDKGLSDKEIAKILQYDKPASFRKIKSQAVTRKLETLNRLANQINNEDIPLEERIKDKQAERLEKRKQVRKHFETLFADYKNKFAQEIREYGIAEQDLTAYDLIDILNDEYFEYEANQLEESLKAHLDLCKFDALSFRTIDEYYQAQCTTTVYAK